jgi:hypothetical protein
MTISILGIIMILATVGVFAYIGIQGLSSKVSSNVDTGSGYDQLASLKSEYSSLDQQFNSTKEEVNSYGTTKARNDFYAAQLNLIKAKSAIDDVESALSTNQPSDEITNRIQTATNQLQAAKDSFNTVKKEIS